jgi:hypothetical protein
LLFLILLPIDLPCLLWDRLQSVKSMSAETAFFRGDGLLPFACRR